MRKQYEAQGEDFDLEAMEDEIYIRDAEGELVRVGVFDDVDDD